MNRVAILYATREGQTRRIAEHIAATLRARDVDVDVVDTRSLPDGFDLARYGAAIVGASIHAGKHEPEMVAFVKNNRAALERIPTAFLSVSGAEATVERADATEKQHADALANVQKQVAGFVADTGWTPSATMPVAGAIAYTQYGFLLRFVMKMITKKEGGPTDTSRDWELTDWAALDRFVDQFHQRMSGAVA